MKPRQENFGKLDINRILMEEMNPIMLMSFVNKKLQHQFGSLDRLVEYYELDGAELLQKLENEGYTYVDAIGKFI